MQSEPAARITSLKVPHDPKALGRMNEEQLRALIRERVRTGQLPPVFGGRTFGGRGSNTACDCCGRIVTRHEIEYEVEIASDLGVSGPIFIAHAQCHWIWWEESGPLQCPPDSPGSQNLVWNALRDTLKRLS